MTTHSKGKYVAYRSKRNTLSKKEIIARMRIAEECRKFCDEPFPNGAVLIDDN